jgi:tail protein
LSTIQRDKITVQSNAGTYSFNDAASLADWPGAYTMAVDDLPGWRDTVDVNVISEPRGAGDGNYTATRFPAKSRMVIIAGYYLATNRAAVDSLFDLIVSHAFPEDTDIKLTRYEPTPKYVTCRVAGPVLDIEYSPVEGWQRWEATLLCSDPFKYDAVNTLSGSTGIAGLSIGGRTYPRVYPLVYSTTPGGTGNQITVNNIGTAKTYPVLTIVGPLASGWRAENSTTGGQLAFDVSLSTGDVLVIDNQAKYATLNGSPVNGLLIGDWWSLARGINVVKLFGDYNATATFSLTAKSRWR